MDDQKPSVIFYCNDPKNTTFIKLESEGASGTISSMLWIAEGLAKLKYSVTVLNAASENNCHLDRGVLFVGLEHESVHQHFKNICPPAVMVCVGIDLSPQATQIRKSINARVWFWHHNPMNTSDTLRNLKDSEIERHIFVSLNHVIRHLKINPKSVFSINKKFAVIYNPLDIELLSSLPLCRKRATKKIKIAYIGNMSPEKGFWKFAELKEKIDEAANNEFEWHVFGNGLYSRQNEKPKIIDGITLHGTLGRQALYREMVDVDIVACGLGGNETFCVTAIEAAYLGKNIITTRLGGQIEVLHKFNNKFYIENIESREDLVGIYRQGISVHCNNDFRLFCRDKYSRESATGGWGALLSGKASSFSFLPNILGTILSLGIKK